jgi:hypothetical protein
MGIVEGDIMLKDIVAWEEDGGDCYCCRQSVEVLDSYRYTSPTAFPPCSSPLLIY